MNQKEKIIEVTTKLIIESKGDLSLVTARKIAEKADASLGLINYHFENKDKLITECVQRIIYKEIRAFVPKDTVYSDDVYEADRQRLTFWAKQVFEFFYGNKSISKVSILGDLQNNMPKSNLVDMQRGLLLALTADVDNQKKNMLVFSLTSIMEAAFLQESAVSERLGYELSKPNERERFIEDTIDGIIGFYMKKTDV